MLWNAIFAVFRNGRNMDKDKLVPITSIAGTDVNEELQQKIISVSEESELVDDKINSYLFNRLGIDVNQMTEERKELIKKNFIHLICQVMDDLSIISNRLNQYRIERTELEGKKSNESEYRRRKLEYFAKLNKRAQDDIVEFLNKDITKYLVETDYDTLQREANNDEWGKIFRNRRYLFAQVSEYYDANFDYSTVVKISQLPNVELVEGPELEKKYLEMHRDDLNKYYVEIEALIKQKRVMENLKYFIEYNYHLNKRREIFEDLARMYEEKHYQSFIALGLIQLEGLFFDICSIKYDEKENAGSLVEKAEKALSGNNEISFMRYYPYFAFDVPIKRNEVAHAGLIKSQNLKQLADELLLDLNAVARMAQLESDGKFRIFVMINSAISQMNSADESKLNRKLIFELFACRNIMWDSFWEVLKNPAQFKDEIEFYRQENTEWKNIDLPSIVKNISYMVYKPSFWCEMVNTLNKTKSYSHRSDEMKQFILSMAKNFVRVLDIDAKNKCIEIFSLMK